jgi:hypothetical protein
MTLKAAFAGLDETLQDFRRALDDLLWAVVQGQPEAKQGHALVDQYDTTTTDLLGLTEEAVAAVKEGRQSREDQIDPAAAPSSFVRSVLIVSRIATIPNSRLPRPWRHSTALCKKMERNGGSG